MKSLRIVFMGTPEFAVASLDALVHSAHKVVGVVTVEDKPAGRGKHLSESAVKQYAVAHEIPLLQPSKLRDPLFHEELRALHADLFVVVAFRMLPEIVWMMPTLGTINLHGSLLPAYRGAAPINWALINGEKETGVTTFFLQQEIDTGKIIKRVSISIGENENAGELHDRLMNIGASTLLETVNLIANNEATAIDQAAMALQGEPISHAPKLTKEFGKINWNKSMTDIHNFIRGLSPYPAAWTQLQGKNFKIFRGLPSPSSKAGDIGSYCTDGKSELLFKCKDGWYSVNELQAEGKKRMGVEEFLRGFRA